MQIETTLIDSITDISARENIRRWAKQRLRRLGYPNRAALIDKPLVDFIVEEILGENRGESR